MGYFSFVRGGVRQFSSVPLNGLLQLKTSQSVAIVSGPDAAKFLNGLLTLRILPSISKTKLTTISDEEGEYLDLSQSLSITDDQVRSRSWGILHDDEYSDGAAKVGIRRDGRYGMLLSSKGRVDSDLFIYPSPFGNSSSNIPSYLVEFNSGLERFRKLFTLLNFHKLRTHITITRPAGVQSWAYFNRSEEFEDYIYTLNDKFFNNEISKSPEESLALAQQFLRSGLLFQSKYYPQLVKGLLGFAIDNRSSSPMIRIITDSSLSPKFSTMFSQKINLDASKKNSASGVFDSNSRLYELLRIKQGLVEMSDYPLGAHAPLPFEFNIDYANGINYNKGCYIGQELTSRTWTRGIIRKRIMPVHFFAAHGDDSSILGKLETINDIKLVKKKGQKDKDEKNDPVINPFGVSAKKSANSGLSTAGNVIRAIFDAGLALVNVNDVDIEATEDDQNANVFQVQSDSVPEINSKVQCRVKTPDWWPIEDEAE